MLAVYTGTTAASAVGCNDDSGGQATSAITLTTDRNTLYYVQAGIYCGTEAADCAAATARGGTLKVTATNTGAPANDDRANAIDLTLDAASTQSNSAATVEPAEPVTYASAGYGKTVWSKFTLANDRRVRVSAGGVGANSVIAVYAAGSPASIACNDDDGGGPQSALTLNLTAGTYFVQARGAAAASRRFTRATASVKLASLFKKRVLRQGAKLTLTITAATRARSS